MNQILHLIFSIFSTVAKSKYVNRAKLRINAFPTTKRLFYFLASRRLNKELHSMLIEESLRKAPGKVGIVAANHPGYVEAMFAWMSAGDVAIPLRGVDDHDRIAAAGVSHIVTPMSGDAWMSPTFRSPDSDETALISFTSGTEGAPKGVLLTHRNLANVVDRLNALMEVDHDIREYVGISVYHSFGFGRCRAVAAVGGQLFIPSNGFNPAEIGGMLKSGEINAISAVPSLWRILLANQDLIGNYGKRVRWIEIGSQYMSRSEKQALKLLFPEAKIVQHYGLTEASRSTLLAIHQAEGAALESVGQALNGVEVRLTSEGQISIRGEHVAQSYLIEGQEVALQSKDGWFLTKDLGRFEDGYLYYEGRADDVINCGGMKVHPEALETKIYAQISCSQGLAVCRKPDPVRGEGFLVAVTKEVEVDRQHLKDIVLQATKDFGVNAGNAIAILEVEDLPKTATGKIQRKRLVEQYTQLNQQDSVSNPNLAAGTPIQAAFCQTLNLPQVDSDDTFISVGGDSLSYVQLAMALERHLGYLPKGWENLSIQDLETLIPQRRRYTLIETGIFLRALAIAGVVANHAELLPMIPGGALLLLLVAGGNLARFQSQALFQGRFLQPIASLIKNLAIPYLILAIAYQLWKREPDISVLLLVSNFVNPFVSSIFPVWFINLLVQLIVGISLLFGVPPIRNFARQAPWKFGCILLGVGLLTNQLMPKVWDTSHLFDRVPHMLGWVFILGWLVQFAKDRARKITTSVLLSAIALSLIGVDNSRTWWLIIGGNLLIWLPYISVPHQIKAPIQTLSAAAYYIYLTHIFFIYNLMNGVGVQNPWVSAIVGLLGGVFMWLGLQFAQQWFAKRRGLGSLDLNETET
jgi:acyl-CoA synthetase (AMP-forming)/AMP-acid ligase II